MRALQLATRTATKWTKAFAVATLFVFSAFSILAGDTNAAATAADHSKSIKIHQEVDFSAGAKELYEALLDSSKFTAFSGRPAEIKGEVGGVCSLFGGHIIARNLELVPNQRIVQAWRVVTWPEGVYSIARFDFKVQGSGTHLVFEHTGFPEGLHDHLAEGWEQNYWTLLKKYFEKKSN
jgi:activator of HSP90 ATPase